uniref:Uncharacterized protein n=1 Tax=Biomphalaria glabrata TaxID=6526 RepID=A0A2C9LVS3_BIOGL
MTTCCAVFGLVFLVLTNLAIIISFATPYWIEFKAGDYQGLWAHCKANSCTWVFEDNYKLNTITTATHIDISSEWWIATQGLMCFGLSLALFSLLFATIALCCDCRGCNTSQVISGLLLMSCE